MNVISSALVRSARLASGRQSQRHALNAFSAIRPSQPRLLVPSLSFHSTTLLTDELPYHIVVGLPALSPTMDSGSLAEWYVSEGDSFSAGDVLAKIETDKATIDFEAQDDGNVAKLLLQAGEGKDLAIGTPIMITVEDSEDVAAFKDYVHKDDGASATPPSPPPAAVPEPKVEATPAPPPPAPVETAAPVAPAAVPAPAVVATPPPPPQPTSGPQFNVAWGLGAASKSPMAKTLAKEHTEYIEKYGTTGQRPLL